MAKILKRKKGKKIEYLIAVSEESITNYFEMLDVNKRLKYNAFTVEQYNRALKFEETVYSILKELAVPGKQY
jgi:hypothetical protein|nr:MAG TPA: hypothetical protein [Caudoviricetes sp.]